jgi:hypothetical protein
MARKILLDTAYTFTPSSATIVIPRYIPRERLILITDVTNNTVLYNFSDPTLKAASYSAVAGQTTWGGQAGTTTIVLSYNTNTSAFNALDKLQVMIDEYEERFTPSETQLDPTNKMRVSMPQSLIDTDFEYSFQPTKWEFFQSQNWNASVFTSTSNSVLASTFGGAGFSLILPSITVSSNVGTISSLNLPVAPYVGSYIYIIEPAANTTLIFGNFRYTVATASTTQITFPIQATNGTYNPQLVVIASVPGTVTNPSYAAFQVSNNLTAAGVNLVAGQPVLAQDTQNEPYCDGTFVVAYINQTQAAFAYFPKVSQQFAANQLQKAQTSLFVGGYYAAGYGLGSIIPVGSMATAADGRTVTIVCYSNHNLVPGAPVYVGNAVLTAANGPWYVQSTPTPYSFTYNVYGGITASQSGASVLQNTTVVYARPEGYQIQRSGDGGIGIFGGNAVAGAQSLRQTRRYFRYQAGKGIQYSTSATFKPNQDITKITVSGNLATITTDQDHGLQYGAVVNLRNITATTGTDLPIYNCTGSVDPRVTLTPRSFGIQLSGTPSDTNPGCGIATVEVGYATGSCIRCGLFDDQNGFFYEYDGTFLNAVRRNGTTILRGTTNVCTGSTIVIGTDAQYTRQVQAGDKIIIRGSVYEVSQVVNDSVLHIAPAYRPASPALASGTAGLPFAFITGGNSTTQTVTLTASANTSRVTFTASSGTGTAGVGGIGVTGAYQVTGTIPRTVSTTLSAIALLNATTITVASASSIVPGQLVVISGAGNLPANTYVAATYVSGSTTVPLTQGVTTQTASATTVDFYNSPASGMNVIAGTMAQGIIANGTQVSAFTNVAGTVGATITIQLYLNQAVVGTTTASTLFIGSVPGYTSGSLFTTLTQVIALSTTYGIQPGMTISGTGIPGNCIVAGLAVAGVGVILNTPITNAVADATTLTFTPNTTLYAITIQTSAASTATSTTLTLSNISGVQVGSFITTTTNSANIPLGTFVTAINTTTNVISVYTPFTTTQGFINAGVASGQNLVFGSRIFVTGATNTNANGMWPISGFPSTTTMTFVTANSVAVSSVISTYGTTKMFAEDIAVKKYQVREVRVPQFQWNMDTFDGTGPTGYNLDATKIQMIYIDYTWYGAGFIRWGARAVNGDIVYAHKTQHGNREYLAFQRSGNLPGRFEAVNAPARSPITVQIPATGYTMSATPATGNITVYDASRYFFPFSSTAGQGLNGEVMIDNELFYYTGIGAVVTANTTGNPDYVIQNTAVPYATSSTAAPWATGAGGLTAVCTATAVQSGGTVTAITITAGGAGYTSAPPVNIVGGGGSGAQARAVIVNGTITQIVVTSGGYGYTGNPTIVVGANQLTGCFRESTAVTSVNTAGFTGTTTGPSGVTPGANTITSVSSIIISQLAIGMVLQANSNFGYLNARIVGISGTTVYVNLSATSGGQTTFYLINRGSSIAAIHYTYNNSGNPLSNAWNTNIMMAPNVQHWGVSAIMDGRYDADISYVFTTPRSTAAVVLPNQTAPLISMRVSPSSSNGFARNFGVRDVVLRMQAKLYQMDVYNAGPFLVTVKYNCASATFTPALWTANSVGSGSLSQVIYHNPSDVVTGGDIILAFYANASGGTFFTSTSADMTVVKDLGNSVYGGDGVFPDGPDVITVFATNLDTRYSNPIFSRISWTESQA